MARFLSVLASSPCDSRGRGSSDQHWLANSRLDGRAGHHGRGVYCECAPLRAHAHCYLTGPFFLLMALAAFENAAVPILITKCFLGNQTEFSGHFALNWFPPGHEGVEMWNVFLKLAHPVCPHCGSSYVARSRKKGLLDFLFSVFHIKPYRCLSCDHRHYRYRPADSRTNHANAISTAHK